MYTAESHKSCFFHLLSFIHVGGTLYPRPENGYPVSINCSNMYLGVTAINTNQANLSLNYFVLVYVILIRISFMSKGDKKHQHDNKYRIKKDYIRRDYTLILNVHRFK